MYTTAFHRIPLIALKEITMTKDWPQLITLLHNEGFVKKGCNQVKSDFKTFATSASIILSHCKFKYYYTILLHVATLKATIANFLMHIYMYILDGVCFN